MFVRRAAAFIFVSVATFACAQNAAAPVGPRSPLPVHERLTFFEGDWTVAGMPPEQNFRETCAWLPEGRRHMVCRSRWVSTNGPREGWSIFSYNASDFTYLYHGFRAGGSVVVHQGREDAGVWSFTSERGTGATLTLTRIKITPQPDGGFVFIQETSTAEGSWKAGDEVRYLRAKR